MSKFDEGVQASTRVVLHRILDTVFADAKGLSHSQDPAVDVQDMVANLRIVAHVLRDTHCIDSVPPTAGFDPQSGEDLAGFEDRWVGRLRQLSFSEFYAFSERKVAIKLSCELLDVANSLELWWGSR